MATPPNTSNPSLSAADFLKLAAQSGLVTPQQCRQLQVQYQQAAVGAAADTAQPLAQWLVTQKHLSRYQAKVLLSGKAGPFLYGAYKVVERLSEGPLKGCFRAVHMSSGHNVLLQFLSGTTVKDSRQWLATAAWLTRVCHLNDPRLHRWYEWVDLGNFKFLVTEELTGRPLNQVLSEGRAKAARACYWAQQAAEGAERLHQAGLIHGELRPEHLWLQSNGSIKVLLHPQSLVTRLTPADEQTSADYLAPELANSSRALDKQTDVYALGCTLYQLLAGRVPFPGGDPAAKLRRHATEAIQPLDGVGVAPNVGQAVAYMMAKNPAVRFKSMTEVATHLAPLAGDEEHLLPPRMPSATLAAYLQYVDEQPWKAAAPAAAPVAITASVNAIPTTVPVAKPVTIPSATVPAPAPAVQAAVPQFPIEIRTEDRRLTEDRRREDRRRPRRKRRGQNLVVFLCVALVMAGGVAVWIAYGERLLKMMRPNTATNTSASSQGSTDSQEGSAVDSSSSSPIEDDGKSLWVSPTHGGPVDFAGVPPESLLTIALRPRELMANPEGQRLVQALGPAVSGLLPQIATITKVPLDSIEQLLISLHGNSDEPLRLAMSVHLREPIPREKLLSEWGNPAAKKQDDDQYYEGQPWSYYFPPSSTDESANKNVLKQFAVGSAEEMKAVAELHGLPPLPHKGMEPLIRGSDSTRLFNLFFVPQFLRANLLRDGRELYFGSAKRLVEPIDQFLGDGIRSGLLSGHLNDNFYVELVLSTDVSRDRSRLAEDLRKNLHQIPRDTEDYLGTRVDAPAYWRKVALRMPAQVQFLADHARVGIENNTVVVNAVLPNVAAHNLTFGTEMLLASLPSDVSVPTTAKHVPATIEELLAEKTTLRLDASNLEVVMQDIVEDVRNTYPQLPFEFDIKIVGEDLLKDGITRNQPIKDFAVENVPISEVLTAITMRCNPITTVKKPGEKDQKLVWVIGDDPGPAERRIVLITSRDGAANRKIELPAVFQLEP